MNIILVGCGKVGSALAGKLIDEGHNITVIDTIAERVQHLTEAYDVMGIVGNGSSIAVLSEADTEHADFFIAVTGSDELNLLCCLFAKKLGPCHAIARVRNPMYSHELDFIRQQLGFSTIINPEMATAREISRLLRFPAAMKIDSFANDRVNLIKFQLPDSHALDNIALKDIPDLYGGDILFCAIERGIDVIIPDGEFVLQSGDVVTFAATHDCAVEFFKKLNLNTKPVRNALLVGGGPISYYLAKDLLAHNIRVRIVEMKEERCKLLSEMLPDATIIHGDGTDRQLLLSEGLSAAEAFVPLTNVDEENIFLSLFAQKHSKAKLVTKVNRFEFDDILSGLDLGSVVYPKYITCDFITQHIRAFQNEFGNNIKTLYHILDDRVEALEFTVQQESNATGKTLSELKLRSNLLICCITRGNEIIIPRGSDQIQVGDTVVVVTLNKGLQDIKDIIAQ